MVRRRKRGEKSQSIIININLSYSFLTGANLEGTDLSNANLECADLECANLTDVNLTDADLASAYLIGADLTNADLARAYLKGANLTNVNLIGVNLKSAYLNHANLTDVKYNHTTSFFELQCPKKGSFIGYKKADNKIVKLLITEDSKRSSATTRRCRCSKAKVLNITSLDSKKNFEKVASDYNSNFVYEVGKIIEIENFDENRWNECSTGIHFFITRDEAVIY